MINSQTCDQQVLWVHKNQSTAGGLIILIDPASIGINVAKDILCDTYILGRPIKTQP
jgi:hypothetical protein